MIKKMMTKLLTVFLCLFMAFGVVGCESSSITPNKTENEPTQSEQEMPNNEETSESESPEKETDDTENGGIWTSVRAPKK